MPDRPDEFEEAWARIVEDLTSGRESAIDPHDDGGPGTQSGPSGPAVADPGPESAPQVPPAAPGAAGAQGGLDEAGTAGLHALFEPLRRAQAQPDRQERDDDPGAFVDNWGDEGHYTPPPPPELPEGTPVKRLAWAGLLGGPAVLALSALTGWQAPTVVWIGAGLATLAGFITLVWHLPESREDGWDDGARL
jgi:hypothetical protein